ncbi:potassium channel family protein [Patescibacteria group bacterium]|nr:potassium channel family protein [Patescibacteria group bacterium]MBU1935389.1 potassium channel family protein [Patescibacteria group bacterium]
MEFLDHKKSLIISIFSWLVDFGNKWLTLSHWIFRSGKNIFLKLEIMMLVLTAICIALLITIHQLPYWLAFVIAILLIQRVLEFVIVYSRNFILNRGRIFSEFHDMEKRGQWLILMFSLNIIQIILIFAIWYRLISFLDPSAFSSSLNILDSFYFSIVTFLTVGYGDITPLTALPKVLVITQAILTFYTIVIVINGLISIHFRR